MLWDPFLYCINDSIQGKSETGNKVFVLPSKVSINNQEWFEKSNLLEQICPYCDSKGQTIFHDSYPRYKKNIRVR